MHAASHTTRTAARYWRIAIIVTSALPFSALAADPPADLIHKIAARETETAKAQANYTYRQTVALEELDQHGLKTGEYREVRDIIFSPTQERTEHLTGKPVLTLRNLKMSEEDFRDIRDVQPFLLTTDQLFLYDVKFRGEESVEGLDCYVIQIRPRQLLSGQRLFDGLLWVDQRDFSIIRAEGQAVPQIRTTQTENLFPHFTTIRKQMEGGFWFPALTYGDDTLYFRSGPQRVRLTIEYSRYQRFGADSTITFDK